MTIQGIIFDCDGTLADTMPAHYEAWLETLHAHGLEMSEDRFYALGGWPSLKVAELLIGESARPLDAAAIADEKEALFEKLIHLVQPIEPVAEVVRAHSRKLPIAVATGATRRICEQVLRQIGLWDAFNTVVSCEDVVAHKPSPDIFLEAARRLNVPANLCRVYEDTDPGIEAARRAGMQHIDVRTFYKPRRVTPQ